MKRLMLDYLRRKWWILATGALFQLVIGWATVSCAADHRFDPFSAFEFQISLFMGAFLLSFDLQRGIARTVAVLPLTARQIGRSWWWVTVGIPAISLAGLLFLGGGLFCLFNPGTTFPTEWLAMVSTITLLWLGTAFALIVNITPGWHGNWWGRTLNILFGSLWGLMIGGGGWLLRDVSNSPLKFYSVLGIGTIASVAGWFLAEQGVRGRAGFRLVASPLGKKKGPIHTPGGYGGIPFLISRSFVRTFLMGLAMITLMQLFLLFQGGLKSWHQAISSVTGMGVSYLWLIILFSIMPAMLQLRFLRSLPISATKLAAVMIVLVILPLIVLSVFVTGISWLALGTSSALTVLRSFTFTLAPATLGVFFFAWLGSGMVSYMLMFFAMMLSQFMSFWFQESFFWREAGFSLAVVIAVVFVASAFLLTRRTLMRGSKAYRVQANPLGAAWGAGR